MADRHHRKPPADPRYPYGQDDLFAQHDPFGDAPAPAAEHELIEAEAVTRVSSQRAILSGAPPAVEPWNDAIQPPPIWPDAGDPAPVGYRNYDIPPPVPYSDPYYAEPGLGDVIPAVGGEVVDPNAPIAPHAMVPASQVAREGPRAMQSWIRENAAEHMGAPSADLVLLSNADGHAAAQFRALRYRLEQDPSARVVVVTSAREGDGKSCTAANLALALAEGGRIKVLLIDASLRSPSLHKLFGIRGDPGLTSVLAARQNDPTLPIDVIRISTSLSLIPAGPQVQSAYAALSSEPAAVLIDQIRQEYRYVIVDSAPVFGTAETLAWHTMIDKYIVVARAGMTTTEDLTAVAERLQRDRILGVTFVGANQRRA